MNMIEFNANHGYLEGVLRGFKNRILTENDYANLMECESLEGIYIYYFIWTC